MRFVVFALIVLISCEEAPRRVEHSYYGSDVDAPNDGCTDSSRKLICEDELAESKDFKARCLQENRKILVCDCDHYLCVDAKSEPEPVPEIPMGQIIRDYPTEHSGIDFDGVERTCSSLPPDVACLSVFTERDQYGMDCRKQGIDIVYCDCGDPICLK